MQAMARQYELDLKWLTSIDRDVARELSYYKGQRILLDGLKNDSISKARLANELTTQLFRLGVWYNWTDRQSKFHKKALVSMV